MMASAPEGVTALLRAWSSGDGAALDRLVPLVYGELHRMARRYLRGENHAPSLQPTALVNEAYLRLVDVTRMRWQDRAHFFAVSAQLMRRILVDHARRRSAGKRMIEEPVDLGKETMSLAGPDILEVDLALSRFAKDHPRQAQVVELRFFGGLTNEEIVETMRTAGEQVSLRTVERDWRFSRAWLQDAIGNSK